MMSWRIVPLPSKHCMGHLRVWRYTSVPSGKGPLGRLIVTFLASKTLAIFCLPFLRGNRTYGS